MTNIIGREQLFVATLNANFERSRENLELGSEKPGRVKYNYLIMLTALQEISVGSPNSIFSE